MFRFCFDPYNEVVQNIDVYTDGSVEVPSGTYCQTFYRLVTCSNDFEIEIEIRCKNYEPDKLVKYQCSQNVWTLVSNNSDSLNNVLFNTTIDKELSCNAPDFILNRNNTNQEGLLLSCEGVHVHNDSIPAPNNCLLECDFRFIKNVLAQY